MANVGVGGLATTGGVGYLGRKFGLTIDHLVAAEIVLADGTFLRVDDEHHADLFWAIRGAGGNFGVVTAFEFRTDPIDQVVFGILIADATNTAPLLERWGRLVEDAPREVTSFVTLVPETRENPTIAQFVIVYAGDEIDAASAAITPFYDQLGPILQQQAQLVPYAAIVAPYDSAHTGKGLDASRSGLVEHVSPQVAQGWRPCWSTGRHNSPRFAPWAGPLTICRPGRPPMPTGTRTSRCWPQLLPIGKRRSIAAGAGSNRLSTGCIFRSKQELARTSSSRHFHLPRWLACGT
jgi:hypothetical protein